MEKNQRPLLTLKFRNRVDGRKMTVRIYEPKRKRVVLKNPPRQHTDWVCKLEVRTERKTTVRDWQGADWLQAFQFALDHLRELHITREHERDWETLDGVSAWVVLPHQLRISYGHKVYANARAAAERVEKKHWSKLGKK